jgi:hypothetical protein
MKKYVFLGTIVLLLSCGCLQAQAVKSIAIKAGVAWATQKNEFKNVEIDQDISYKTGLHLALNAEFLQHPFISILAEVGYTQKGNKQEIELSTAQMPEGTGEMRTYNTTFSYGYLAPMIKLRKEFGGFVPYIFVGPRIDYQFSYTSDFNLSAIEDDFNKVLFGLNYGLGLEYMFGQIGVGAVFHQQLDFSKIYSKTPENFGLESIKNNAFILDLTVKYYFGKK